MSDVAPYRTEHLLEAVALLDQVKEKIERHIRQMPSAELAERFDRVPGSNEAQRIHSSAAHPDGLFVLFTVGARTAWKHEVVSTEIPKDSLYRPQKQL